MAPGLTSEQSSPREMRRVQVSQPMAFSKFRLQRLKALPQPLSGCSRRRLAGESRFADALLCKTIPAPFATIAASASPVVYNVLAAAVLLFPLMRAGFILSVAGAAGGGGGVCHQVSDASEASGSTCLVLSYFVFIRGGLQV